MPEGRQAYTITAKTSIRWTLNLIMKWYKQLYLFLISHHNKLMRRLSLLYPYM